MAKNTEVLGKHMWREVDGASLKIFAYIILRQDEEIKTKLYETYTEKEP